MCLYSHLEASFQQLFCGKNDDDADDSSKKSIDHADLYIYLEVVVALSMEIDWVEWLIDVVRELANANEGGE